MAIGAQAIRSDLNNLAASAREQAARMPDLLIEAARIANHVLLGWHGRRRRGTGESFWQFRPYVEGESVARIDWRRSARDDHTYLRDREWEAAQTIWIWPDQTQSMAYRSRFAQRSKIDHALLLSLALGDLFSRAGERVGIPATMQPTHTRDAAERMAMSLVKDNRPALPDAALLTRYSEVILISDFLDEPGQIKKKLGLLAQLNIRAHLIEIADPAEAQFPYQGRIEFNDPESGERYLAGQAQSLRDDYQRIYKERRDEIEAFAGRHGWSYTISMTDKPLTETIFHLANVMNAVHGYRREGI